MLNAKRQNDPELSSWVNDRCRLTLNIYVWRATRCHLGKLASFINVQVKKEIHYTSKSMGNHADFCVEAFFPCHKERDG